MCIRLAALILVVKTAKCFDGNFVTYLYIEEIKGIGRSRNRGIGK